jgi:hypothetical protein
MKLYIFISFLLIVSPASIYCQTNAPSPSKIDYEIIADEITMQAIDKLEKTKHLKFAGWGGAMMNDIQEMHLSFNCYTPMNISSARRLVIECVEEYLKIINSNETLRPYLHNYPFTNKQIELTIYIYDHDDNKTLFPFLGCVASWKNTIYYLGYDEKPEAKKMLQEPYDEAVKIVEKEANKK